MIIPYKSYEVYCEPDVFIAPGSYVIGRVHIASQSSVWYQSVIRADVHEIKIGRMTNIQDGCVLHVTDGKFGLYIGSYVTVGHKAILHGCILKDYCLIGMGSTVLDGAIVKPYSIVAAGALVPPRMEVPERKVVAGVPAKILRDVTEEERNHMSVSAQHYYTLSQQHQRAIH